MDFGGYLCGPYRGTAPFIFAAPLSPSAVAEGDEAKQILEGLLSFSVPAARDEMLTDEESDGMMPEFDSVSNVSFLSALSGGDDEKNASLPSQVILGSLMVMSFSSDVSLSRTEMMGRIQLRMDMISFTHTLMNFSRLRLLEFLR